MDGYVQIGTQLDTKDFDAEIKYVESKLEEIEYKLKQADMGFEVGDTQKLEAQYSRLIKQLDRLQKKQIDINKTDLTNIQKNIDKVGDSVTKTISKVGKWALAIFSVRSAYMALRSAMSVLTQYNQDLADKLNTIKLTFASALEPIITRIVDLVHGLLVYIDYIANAWFGMNLLASANEKAMNKTNKSAKELKKTMAGFDEMNVINDSSSGGASTQTGFVEPKDVPIPSWIKWIADNKDVVTGALVAIATGLLAVELGAKGIMGLGIGILLGAITMLIMDIIDFIKDPSWENFIAILGDIAIGVGAIMLIMTKWWGLLIVIIGLIIKLVAENWDKIKEILGSVGSWIYEHIIKPVGDFFANLWEGIKTGFGSVVQFFNSMISKIVGIFQTIGARVGEAIGTAFKLAINSVLNLVEGILNTPINAINGLLSIINSVPGVNLGKLPTLNLPRLAVGGIVNMPGRGVMVGSAIAGERGQEAVIPLTNSQMMAELGEAIGRYININATVPVYVGNRQIAREIKKINASNDFATNS
ncbi:MAG: hypothetical protein IJ358_01965 [Clostridia bacterium]|nr:hypothetical protein [Clostridia bacterium]